MDLTYTPLSDGFKIAKNDDGNIVFARNDTTLFVADPADLGTALAPLGVSVASGNAQAVVDTTTADALTAANAKIDALNITIGQQATELNTQAEHIISLEAQIEADQKAAAAIQAAIGAAGAADAAPSSSEPAAAPTIAPSNASITGS